MLLVTIKEFETNPVLVNMNNSNLINIWNLKFKKKKQMPIYWE
jgi:hypothetical protein